MFGVNKNLRDPPRRGRPPCLPAPSVDEARPDPRRRPHPETTLTRSGVSFILSYGACEEDMIGEASTIPAARRNEGRNEYAVPAFPR